MGREKLGVWSQGVFFPLGDMPTAEDGWDDDADGETD